MANPQHLKLLQQGVDAWNALRAKAQFAPDLSGADFFGADFAGANLSGADLHKTNFLKADLRTANLSDAVLSEAHLREVDLSEADLRATDLCEADLRGANLVGAKLHKANLSGAILRAANLVEANLSGAVLSGTDLSRAQMQRADLGGADLQNAIIIEGDLTKANLAEAHLVGANLRAAELDHANLCSANLGEVNLRYSNLRGADFSNANLTGAVLVEADLTDAVLTGCFVFGISAWSLKLSERTKQRNLIITASSEPVITTDDLEVAQFLHLMLHNDKLRRIVDTITSKVVLILGRFSADRKPVLDALRDELRKPERGYVPVVFDFEKPGSRTTDETITLLARMARFVIADISDAKSVLQELRGIVPDCPTIPIQTIIIAGQEEPGMFDFFKKYPWFLEVHRYKTPAQLFVDLDKRVIGPLEAKAAALRLSAK